MFKTAIGSHKNILPEVIKLCNGVKVVEIEYDGSCAESYPCQHFGGMDLILENGEKVHYDCDSVQMGMIFYYYKIDNKHFTNYLNADTKHQIDNLNKDGTIATKRLNTVVGPKNNILPEVIKLCNQKKVVKIEYNGSCAECYPCRHSGGIDLVLENGEKIHYNCDSVQMGMIFYYYKIDNTHFTEYLGETAEHQIDNLNEDGTIA